MTTILHAIDDFGVRNYLGTLARAAERTECTGAAGTPVTLNDAFDTVVQLVLACHRQGSAIFCVGNGGSAAIASHMVTDLCKNGLRARVLNDSSMLTCLANDFGYAQVFAHQIEVHARSGDVLIAVSSSGRSENIVRAAEAANRLGCSVVTLSGFDPGNRLRGLGEVNLYVPSAEYGIVELAHMCLCHAVTDLALKYAASPTPQPLAESAGHV